MFPKRFNVDVPIAQKAFDQNSLEVAEFIVCHAHVGNEYTKIAIVVDTFLAAVVYM